VIDSSDTIATATSINSEATVIRAAARTTLADALRNNLGLTGTHLGCEHGVCGACTVLIDGQPARSCLVLAVEMRDHEITTIEGLADGTVMHPVQAGFYECHSFQCGFCTPGFVMTTVSLLERNPQPTEAEVRAELSGNLCRCTGYQSIIDGVLRSAELAHKVVG
jgi:aerobic carbon-monoxide dehydrogenase small subunit